MWDPHHPEAPSRTVPHLLGWTPTRIAWIDIDYDQMRSNQTQTGRAIPAGTPVHLLDPTTGTDTVIAGSPLGPGAQLSFSPTGRYAVAVNDSGRLKDVWILDLATHAWSRLPGMPLNSSDKLLTTWTPGDQLVLAAVSPTRDVVLRVVPWGNQAGAVSCPSRRAGAGT